MRYMKMLGTVLALSLIAVGTEQGVQDSTALWSQTTAQMPISAPGPAAPPPPDVPPLRFRPDSTEKDALLGTTVKTTCMNFAIQHKVTASIAT